MPFIYRGILDHGNILHEKINHENFQIYSHHVYMECGIQILFKSLKLVILGDKNWTFWSFRQYTVYGSSGIFFPLVSDIVSAEGANTIDTS